MKDSVRKIIDNRWLTCISRVALGCILIVASIGKLQDHERFTDTVVNYGMMPDFLAQAYGFFLPWAELFIGLCLILGIFVRFASLLSIPIILSFIVANIYSLLHTSPDICDCFGGLVSLSHPASLGIDIVMLVLAGQIWLNKRSGEFLSFGPLIYRLSIGSGGAKRFLFEKGSMFAVVVLVTALVASFTPDIYGEPANVNLNISMDPIGGGSVTPFPQGNAYVYGTEVTLTAAPQAGYVFDRWSGDVSGSDNPAIITMNSEKAITAHFAPTDKCTLTIEVNHDYGGNQVQMSSLGPYDPGTEVTLTATPGDKYNFGQWSGAVSGDTSMVTIIMDSNKIVTAHFIPTETYTLTVIVDPADGGTVVISPLQDFYAPGTPVELEARANLGNHFSEWEGDLSGNTNPTTIIIMDSNKTVTAKIDCG